MATKLLSEYLIKTLHIALLILISQWGFQVEAQSVLLPGDVAVVSVNATNNSADLIPLIDIEEGTVLNLSAGKWDSSAGLLTGTEATLYFKQPVPAGSNIYVDGRSSDLFDFKGRLPFVRSENQFYVFQKEESVYRFIYGISFGADNIDSVALAAEIPPVLSETENTFVQLGEKQNFQYFIRNGASGTQDMLLGFLGDSENWNSNEKPFSPFGTSFNVLTPPVVMFQGTTSSFSEADTTAALQVTIFEHDGSRVSVDVEFEASQSSADSMDFNEFNSQTLNFTGLVGTYTTEVNLPIVKDENFEGREGAIFYLKNLTGGSLGDFISHSVAIHDYRVPNLVITDVSYRTDKGSFVEISNLENSDVSLKGWTLTTEKSELRIDSSLVLGPYKKMRFFDGSHEKITDSDAKTHILNGLSKYLFKGDEGLLSLKSYTDKIVHQVGFTRSRSLQKSAITADRSQRSTGNEQADDMSRISEGSSVQSAAEGWTMYTISYEAASSLSNQKKLYVWNDRSKAFETMQSIDYKPEEVTILGFFEADEIENLNKIENQNRNKEDIKTITLSATDFDKDGSIEGTEGLNLIKNPLNEELLAGVLINVIREKLKSAKSIEVFRIKDDSEGSFSFEVLNESNVITGGSYFLVKLNKEMESVTIDLVEDELAAVNREFGSEAGGQLSGDIGSLEISLESGSKQQKIELFIDPENELDDKTDLNAYLEFLPEEHSSFIFSVKQSEDFYKSVSIPESIEQIVELPLNFGSSTNDSYTLSVDKWESIPSGWNVKLIDTHTDKEYDLRAEFSVTFDHSFNNSNEKQNSERFVIQFVPEAARQQAKEFLSDVPKEIELNQNYPNPFNPVTTISFYLPESQEVKLSIFNIVGQPVAVLAEGRLSSGRQQFEWDATDKPSGMYIYQLEVGDKVMTRKMTLVK
ncbi:T9SS type A sorting domain-containing protein [Gracilimonas sp. Q87]|uniref:T9SS type A sorting domain-containing protein n=1 Tax=Gracilimonas sp. Q87 TaxID=3384766 RepID=UPI003984030B